VGGNGAGGRPGESGAVAEWPERQRLAYEKEALGFYLSGHPLLRVRDEARRLATTDAARLDELPDQSEVRLCGVVSQLREIVTRKGSRMCRAVLEDLTGFVELVVFADLYQEVEPLLKGEEPLLVTGTLDRSEERLTVLATAVRRLADVRAAAARTVHIELPAEGLDEGRLAALRDRLAARPGRVAAVVHLRGVPAGHETLLRLPTPVEPSEALEAELESLFGRAVVRYE
ncbi:MAG TPA: OB-fold nucleic acid binding domain-containing protein, partial [Thermodesulfobacteriota bacterium]|nr:OB-fold nucleic acid binding domain-containing protein [Thermodesulfobacteriota bacterium]